MQKKTSTNQLRFFNNKIITMLELENREERLQRRS